MAFYSCEDNANMYNYSPIHSLNNTKLCNLTWKKINLPKKLFTISALLNFLEFHKFRHVTFRQVSKKSRDGPAAMRYRPFTLQNWAHSIRCHARSMSTRTAPSSKSQTARRTTRRRTIHSKSHGLGSLMGASTFRQYNWIFWWPKNRTVLFLQGSFLRWSFEPDFKLQG